MNDFAWALAGFVLIGRTVLARLMVLSGLAPGEEWGPRPEATGAELAKMSGSVHVIDLKARLPCDGQVELGGQIFRCWKRSGHGPCDLHRALKESCDCYFYEVARRVGIDAIAVMARKLGLGQTFDTGLAFQSRGLVPDAAWKLHGMARFAEVYSERFHRIEAISRVDGKLRVIDF